MYPIIFHTSKTMRPPETQSQNFTTPQLIEQAQILHGRLAELDPSEIKKIMKISDRLTTEVMQKITDWPKADKYRAAEYFAGDIYTGLNVNSMTEDDLNYAQERLVILSGLYGILRPLDLIAPFRLEMGYKLTATDSKNLYDFWQPHLQTALPKSDVYIHLSSEEYFKVIRHIISNASKVIAPVFLTRKNDTIKHVTIHSKVARGAYANWLLKNRIENLDLLPRFNSLGYSYSHDLSSELNPTYIKEA